MGEDDEHEEYAEGHNRYGADIKYNPVFAASIMSFQSSPTMQNMPLVGFASHMS